MSGHSKWATTKHKKAAIDAKRGKLFARLIKNIEVAARTGGGDPTGNPTLFDAIQKAKKNSVPADNITRAVKRGSGEEAGGADWQTIMYEGYGPGGVAFLVECLTDNRNRAASDVRVAFSRNGGNLADPGSVAYNFTRKGVVEVAKADGVDEDSILMAVLEAGAEYRPDGGGDGLRLRRGPVRRRHQGGGRCRRSPQGLPPHRRPGGLRRRPERLHLGGPQPRGGRRVRRRRGLSPWTSPAPGHVRLVPSSPSSGSWESIPD